MTITAIAARPRPAATASPEHRSAVTPRRAGWEYVGFAVRQIAPRRDVERSHRAATKCASSCCRVSRRSPGRPASAEAGAASARAATCSPTTRTRCICRPARRSRCARSSATEIAECRSPTAKRFPARVIRPEDCGLEVRGGGNATRQIIDILPPAAAGRSSARVRGADAGRQLVELSTAQARSARAAGRSGPGRDLLLSLQRSGRVRHSAPLHRRWIASIRPQGHRTAISCWSATGYHPFVAAPGFDAYYLNTLAGSFRSMAATDDPALRPPARELAPSGSARVPMIARPAARSRRAS